MCQQRLHLVLLFVSLRYRHFRQCLSSCLSIADLIIRNRMRIRILTWDNFLIALLMPKTREIMKYAFGQIHRSEVKSETLETL